MCRNSTSRPTTIPQNTGCTPAASGGNAFHGAAYEYLRNTNLDANNFFNNREGIGKQPWHQNQWGADLGGPIKHNKMFFFADYQGYWQQAGETVLRTVPTGTVPTAGSPGSGTGEYAGDFSAISEPIYNPFTTCGVAGNAACTPAQQAGTAPTRQQFSYNGHPNVIPPSEMSSVGVNLLALPYFAKSNVPGTSTPDGEQLRQFGHLWRKEHSAQLPRRPELQLQADDFRTLHLVEI
jgi:hypothetical protein